MISAKRMVEIFRRRGGGDYADLRQKLTADQIAYLQNVTGEEPVVAMMSSEKDWFAITKSFFAVRWEAQVHRISLHEISRVSVSNRYHPDIRRFERIKADGGEMDIGLQDGTEFTVTVKPGGPYLGLMNVLMGVARTNRKRAEVKNEPDRQPPTTDDQRPTTQS